jgi:hypothetical protein
MGIHGDRNAVDNIQLLFMSIGLYYVSELREKLRRNPVSLCPPQISHQPNRGRTLASAVQGRRLTAWALARSMYNSY